MFMPMYMFHIAFGIGLIALVMGLAMTKCCCNKGACDTNTGKCGGSCHCGKWCGIIISILAVISLACLVNTAYKQMNSPMMQEMEKMSAEQMHKMHDEMAKDMKDGKKQ